MVWVSVANFLKKPRLALLGTGNIANFHVEAFKKAGFEEIESWRANQSDKWAGTLVLTGKKLGY